MYLDNGHLRLSNGSSGTLEVYLDGWKRACDYYVSPAISNVVCRYLGYRDAVAFYTFDNGYISAMTNIITNLRCFGNESNILECRYGLSSSCGHEIHISCRSGTVYEFSI